MDGVEARVTAISARQASLDSLVDNAGVAWGAPPDALPEIGLDRAFDTNVMGLDFLTRRRPQLLRVAGTAEPPALVAKNL